MKTILWVSRHAPTKAQQEELEEIFGEHKIVQRDVKVEYPTDIEMMMELYNADEVVVVLPLWVIEGLLELGIEPIKAEMVREWTDCGAEFKHRCFKRYKKIDIETVTLN
jgi:hypothetical protein